MVIERGDICWADLGSARGSAPAQRRPIVIVQSDAYTATRIATVVGAVVSGNTDLAGLPGNVFLPAGTSGLRRDSVINVTQVVTVDKSQLERAVGQLPGDVLVAVEVGLRRVLDL